MTAAVDPFAIAADLLFPEPDPAELAYRWLCDLAACDGTPHEGWPHRHARADQHPPPGEWLTWLLMAGRGWGKTRTGAEFVKDGCPQSLLRLPGSRWALVAATFTDGRDTMVEGESGLLSVLPPSALRGGSVESAWNRSMGEIYLANGSRAKVFSSERPDRLRGPQHHGAWGDEPAHWLDASLGDADDTTWSNLLLGLRLGDDPRCVLTTTPKRKRLLVGTRDRPGLVKQPTTVVTRGSTYDNLDNLAPTFRQQVLDKYEGTRLGRQELHAELLEDVEGALWTGDMIEATRVNAERLRTLELARVVVAVDPSGGDGPENDEQGIVVAGKGYDGRAYVLADRSCKLSPDGWGRRAVQAWLDFGADTVVAERNYGGAMVESTIRTAAEAMAREGKATRSVPYKHVNASRGKKVRAEPVAALYEQKRVSHVGDLPELEDEQTTWEPESGESPNRMDALVWALTELMLGQGEVTQQTYQRHHRRR